MDFAVHLGTVSLSAEGLVDFGKLFKAFDGIVTLVDSIKGPKEQPNREGQVTETPSLSMAEQLQAGLTNVVVAALKEAFDRDRARLEMERAHLEEQRLQAEARMRMEIRRQAAEREAGRLKLLTGIAVIGWIVSVVLLLTRIGQTTAVSRITTGIGSLLLLSALGFAFSAYSRIPDPDASESREPAHANDNAALWLVLAGLALTIASVVI
jgi:hypothetical protein